MPADGKLPKCPTGFILTVSDNKKFFILLEQLNGHQNKSSSGMPLPNSYKEQPYSVAAMIPMLYFTGSYRFKINN